MLNLRANQISSTDTLKGGANRGRSMRCRECHQPRDSERQRPIDREALRDIANLKSWQPVDVPGIRPNEPQ